MFLVLGWLTMSGFLETLRDYFSYPVTTTTEINYHPEVRSTQSWRTKTIFDMTESKNINDKKESKLFLFLFL